MTKRNTIEGTAVDVSGTVSFVEPVRGWKSAKNKASLEHLGLHANAIVDGSARTESAGVSFNHITACPCVQKTYKHALSQAQDDVGAAIERVAPLLTHSQRCRTRVTLDGLDSELDVAHLLEALDATLYRVQNTLPRDHELALVYRAHAAPQFIEDAVRETLRAVADAFGDRHPDAAVRVDAVSYESIHDYDIVADVHTTLAELKALPRAA